MSKSDDQEATPSSSLRGVGVPYLDLEMALGSSWRAAGRLYSAHRSFVSRILEIPRIENVPITHATLEDIRNTFLDEISTAVEGGLSTSLAIAVLESIVDQIESRMNDIWIYLDFRRTQAISAGVQKSLDSMTRINTGDWSAIMKKNGLDSSIDSNKKRIIQKFHGHEFSNLVHATDPERLKTEMRKMTREAQIWRNNVCSKLSEVPEKQPSETNQKQEKTINWSNL